MDAADRATGLPEKHRAAPKALAIGPDAGGDRASGLRAFDHDDTHVSLPLILKARNRPVGLRLLPVRLFGGIAHLCVVLIEHGSHARGGVCSNRPGRPLERSLDVN
jgi:hypothetical protein